MKKSILVSALGAWLLVLLPLGVSWSQEVSQDMIDRETTRLEMQIKNLEDQKMQVKIGDSAASERHERSIEHVKDRLRLLRDDPDQYFYNRQAQQHSVGRQYVPPTTTPTPAEPTPQRPLQGRPGWLLLSRWFWGLCRTRREDIALNAQQQAPASKSYRCHLTNRTDLPQPRPGRLQSPRG